MMSLFDVFRYPISDIPTNEELDALPYDLMNQWQRSTSWGTYLTGRITSTIVSFYITREKHFSHGKAHNDIILLRKLIREYDEPI